MTPFDHLFAAVLLVVLPVAAVVKLRRVRERLEADEPGARAGIYRETIVMQWALVALLAVLWQVNGRAAALLGLTVPAGLWLAVSVLISVVVVAFFWRQLAAVSASADLRQQVRGQLDKQPAARLIIPRTAAEARLFTWLAITAGICEEVLYRGFLWWYIAGLVPSAWLAAALVIVVFAVAHAYQGLGGIIRTGLAGAVALAAYLGTGSLIASIVLHITIDVVNGRMAHLALTSDAPNAPATPGAPGVEA